MKDVKRAMAVWIAQRGMKKMDVAKRMGISSRKLSDILHGRRRIDEAIIKSFCKAVSVTPNELFL